MEENSQRNPIEKLLPEHGTPDPQPIVQNATIVEPQQTPSPLQPPQTSNHSSAISIVLQWLVYVFWFWTLADLATVLSGVLIHILIEEARNSTWIIYAAAPLIVLLPLAIVTDHYYKKAEPKAKHGFAAVVMVVNAVIAALGAVGSVIGIVYALLDLLLSTRDDMTGNAIAAIVCTITALLSSLFFVRVLYIDKLRLIRSKFNIIVSAVTVIAVLLTLIYPLANELKRKTDRIIEDNYSDILSDIRSYTNDNSKLPESLDKVTFEAGAKRAIDTGKITYNAISQPLVTNRLPSLNPGARYQEGELKYELCVDWAYERDSGYDDDYLASKGYYAYEGHKAGKQCYEESTYYYNDYQNAL